MEDIKNYVVKSYSEYPSVNVVLLGLGLGALRIATNKVFFDKFPRFKEALSPPPKLSPIVIIPIATGVMAPFLEEPIFRGRLSKKSTMGAIVINTLIFGAITIGGAFYATAQVLTGNLWTSTIAHLMYNTHGIFSYLGKL